MPPSPVHIVAPATAGHVPVAAPAPPRRPFAVGEIVAWVIILGVVSYIAVRASINQFREAAAHEPDITLPMSCQYAVGAHSIMAFSNPAGAATTGQQLLSQLDTAAKVPEDQLRVAIVAGEFLGKEEALKRLEALALQENAKSVAVDIQTALLLYRGDQISEEARVAFQEKYQWFSKLLAAQGKPETDPDRQATLNRAYLIIGTLLGGMGLAGLLTVAGLVLLIIAIVRLAQRKMRLAFTRADPPEHQTRPLGFDPLPYRAQTGIAQTAPVAAGSQSAPLPPPPLPVPSDRRTYAYAMAVYLGGYLVLGLMVRLAMVYLHVPDWIGIFTLMISFSLGLLLPLVLGQTLAQWRLALGLHRGRGVLREMGSGIVGYLAGMPLMGLGIIGVIILTRISGLKGSHPITEELHGGPLDLFFVFVLACVFAPVTEELMFRGALFAHLRERFGWTVSAVVMGVIFALMHPQSWVALPVLAAIAVVFAGIREWRGSIIGSMTAHAMHNGMALVLTLLLLR